MGTVTTDRLSLAWPEETILDIPARDEARSPAAARWRRATIWLASVALSLIVLLASLEFLRRQGLDPWKWLASIWTLIAAIPLPFVVLALALKASEVALNAYAWTTVLRASFPGMRFSFRQTLGVVQGGVGIFAVVPPKFGGFAVLGLYRLAFPTIPIMTVLATRAVQGISSTILGTLLFLAFMVVTAGFGSHSGYLDVVVAFYTSQPLLATLLTALVIVAVLLLVRHGREWTHAVATQIALGGAILRTPRRYVLRVVVPTLLAFAFRWGVTATLLSAFGIPLSWETLLKVNVSHGIARSVQITPGGLGTVQAFDLVALGGVAPVDVIVAYSLSEATLLFAFNLLFGLVALIWAFGWERTRQALRFPGRSAEAGRPAPRPGLS
jgi:hypothetical protein